MAKLELRGFFVEIKPIEKMGDKQTEVQKVIFKVPGYTDDFGTKVTEDELWELTVIGKTIPRLNLLSMDIEKPKAKLKVFINSRVWYKKEDLNKDEPQYSLEAKLHEVEHIA